MNDSNKQIKIGTIISYIAIIFSILSGLIYTPWILKTIGDNDYGIYTLALSFISLFLVDFGLGQAVSKFATKYVVDNDIKGLNNFLGIVYKLYILIDIIICVLLISLYFFIGNIFVSLTSSEIAKFKIIYIILGIYNLIQFPFINLSGILLAYERIIFMKICDLLQKVFVVVLTVVFLLSGGGLYELVIVNALSGLVLLVIKLIYLKKNTEFTPNLIYRDRNLIKEVFTFSVWVTVISIVSRFYFTLAPSILAIVSGTKEITLFGFASTLEGYVYTFSFAMGGMFIAKVTKISNSDNEQRMQELMVKVGRIQLFISGLICVGWIALGKRFICDIWLGDKYINVYYCTILLIIPNWLSSTQLIANTIITVKNEVKSQAIIYLLIRCFYLAFAFGLGRNFGTVGLCIAITIAYLIELILVNIIIYIKHLKLNMIEFYIKTYLKILPWQIAIAIIGVNVNNIILSNEKYVFIILSCIVGGGYSIIMYLFCLDSNEKEKVKNFLIRKRKSMK